MHLSCTFRGLRAVKKPYPWYSDTRSGGGWFVKLGGGQKFLGKHPEGARPPRRGRAGRWDPPPPVLDEFYKLMALRDTASKADYPLGTVCALYLEELGETNPGLAKRYQQTLRRFCEFEYKGRRGGEMLVNAEIEGGHLRRGGGTGPSGDKRA